MDLSLERMYQAIIEKDSRFEGIFYTAVKTTGIFCRPTCTARKPKKENVEFFNSSLEAFKKGYRPCKVCKPRENLNQTPEPIRLLMDELSHDPSARFKDADLIAKGLEPHSIRRWFIKNHKMSFHAYQRMYRINSAFKNVQQGTSVTSAAFDSGFESLSGFADSYKKIFGFSPKKGKVQQVIDLKRIETPLGTMIACAVRQQATMIARPDALRAVANANGMNKISILVPCHRVIGSDGTLTGYGGGLWRKQWLLEMESANK